MPDSRVVYDLDERNRVTVFGSRGPWEATMALRFAKRKNAGGYIRHILQQLYAAEDGATEWRDVPMVGDDG